MKICEILESLPAGRQGLKDFDFMNMTLWPSQKNSSFIYPAKTTVFDGGDV
jgi:hypothetical protein